MSFQYRDMARELDGCEQELRDELCLAIEYIAELEEYSRGLEKELAKRPTRKLTMEERYDLAVAKLVHHHELPTGEDS